MLPMLIGKLYVFDYRRSLWQIDVRPVGGLNRPLNYVRFDRCRGTVFFPLVLAGPLTESQVLLTGQFGAAASGQFERMVDKKTVSFELTEGNLALVIYDDGEGHRPAYRVPLVCVPVRSQIL